MRCNIWWEHARIPLLCFALTAGALAMTSGDLTLANALFFDVAQRQWRGANSWWTNEFLHTGGRWAIRAIVLVALSVWLAAKTSCRWRALQRPASYFVVSVVLSVGLVGLLKVMTNIDCPWDLAPFGGNYPFVHLFAARPDGLPPARCFPAAHASSGYALFALYFVLRERSSALARAGLVTGLITGLVFGIAQQSRGAHFLSHDVWSASLAWLVSLTLYVFGFDARLWAAAADDATQVA